MKLNDAGLKDRQAWEEKGYALPAYDREKGRFCMLGGWLSA